MSTVSFAQSAETDLLEAWTFIAEQSFEAADHVLDVIEQEAQTLALQPLMGRARPELAEGIRCWPHIKLIQLVLLTNCQRRYYRRSRSSSRP
jgi:plasmid stabilization system protein ParE